MSISPEWDHLYRNQQHQSIWPWSDVVSYVMRYTNPSDRNFRVLELGCGAGANIPFFTQLNVEYYAIDGSEYTIDMLSMKYPGLSDRLIVGDFTEELPFSGSFDLIFDRAAVVCNSTETIRRCLNTIRKKLKMNSVFIGIDWYSTEHSDFGRGRVADDPFTFTDYRDGSFTSVGRIHFSDESHLLDLFSDFDICALEHKKYTTKRPNSGDVMAAWNFVARRRA